ncbi:PRMT5-domain-containing protein [Dentipellis sp. KUC8613]|nr:PRMT5-domain-containing protein [Dentipellis sp. KUC8613]
MASWDATAGIAAAVSLEDLGRAPTAPDATVGIDAATPVLQVLAEARHKNYTAVCLPLTTEKWKDRWKGMCVLPVGQLGDENAEAEQRAEAWRASPAFARDEVTMTRLDEAEGVVAMISDWLELDAFDDWVRHDSEMALQQELGYASYLNVQSAILPPPRHRDQAASYGRAVNNCLNRVPYIQLSVRLPIYDPSIFQPKPIVTPALSSSPPESPGLSSTRSSTPEIRTPDARADPKRTKTAPSTRASEAELNATWEMWDIIRSICDYNPRLTLKPIRHVFLPAATFIANGKGYPVLPKGSQTFIRDIMKVGGAPEFALVSSFSLGGSQHRPTVILSGAAEGLHSRGGEAAYLQYVQHLEKTSPLAMQMKTAGTVENFAQGYLDYLQAPLQPLMDNLQSITYQTFEQDPVKYERYETAILNALLEWPECDRIVITVAGAGRGPLVARCLSALERSKRQASIYAIEKNPSAFVTLQERKANEWQDKVELIFGDMRTLAVPEQADIIVSELLGSFGDNELSPECLDGAMRFLKPDGISIPASYTAYLAPLSSSKLYNEVRAGKNEKASETPYVVMFQAVNILSGDGGGQDGRCGPQVQECWDFEHPRRDAILNEQGLPPTNTHNTRSAKLNFHIPHAGVLHGLAGYFEAILYGNVGLSIHPLRKDQISKDMLSWFPLLFPLKLTFRQEPLYLPSNSELQVSIWRLTNQRQVWYEWYAESFLPVFRPLADSRKDGPAPSVDGRGSFIAATSTPFATPSPLLDALDNPFIASNPHVTKKPEDVTKIETGVVKIGQTSLHNPGGRSSWIGL